MSLIMDAARRFLGMSVRDLAGEVDAALQDLAAKRGIEAACKQALELAQSDVSQAEKALREARDALFTEHPDLVGDTPQPKEAPVQPDNPLFEPVEVDDENDPRYTSGASAVSAVDGDPLPPIVWTERDE